MTSSPSTRVDAPGCSHRFDGASAAPAAEPSCWDRQVADHRNAPVNALGYLRIMFAVEDIDDTLARLRPHGAELVGELVQYEDEYRLCYVRGPEGILIGLAEQIG